MDAPLIALSPACVDDGPFFLGLRNHPETRCQSFDPHEISEAEHQAWLTLRLTSPLCHLYVATERGILVGMGRLDLFGQVPEAEVSLAVAHDHQGRGIGTALIEALAREATALGLTGLTASIKESNSGSRIAFGRAGFVIETIKDNIVTMVKMIQ